MPSKLTGRGCEIWIICAANYRLRNTSRQMLQYKHTHTNVCVHNTIALTLALVWYMPLGKLFLQFLILPPFSKIMVTVFTYKMETHLQPRRLLQCKVCLGSPSALWSLAESCNWPLSQWDRLFVVILCHRAHPHVWYLVAATPGEGSFEKVELQKIAASIAGWLHHLK